MRLIAVAVVTCLLLAGCVGGKSPTSTSTSSTLTGTSGALANATKAKPLVFTDTLHVFAPGNLTTRAPRGTGDPNQTALATANGGPGFGGGQNGGSNGRFDYTLRATENLTAYEAHVWVRVIDQLVAAPDSMLGCAWSLVVTAQPANAGNNNGNTRVSYARQCSGPSGPTIAPGDYELVFHADNAVQATKVNPGDVLRLQLSRSGTSPTPNNSVVILSGTTAFDSRITFTGLKEPVQ